MGDSTAIAWTDHTFNPWMGCTKVSPACDHCYAEALGKRTGRVEWGDDAERVPTSDGYWKNPAKWNKAAEAEGRRHRVFCASMADVFEDRDGLDDLRGRLFGVISETPWLDWQLLTKRPENVMRMVGYGDTAATWPRNVWIGTTVEDQERADERILHLVRIPAAVRFLSCEPLLGPLTFRWAKWHPWRGSNHLDGLRQIGWVIVGGESGAGHRPLDLDNARAIRDECEEAGVPFFFKQVGGQFPKSGGDLLDGIAYKEFPAYSLSTESGAIAADKSNRLGADHSPGVVS